ncbi:sulfur reduction protein DsrE [Acidithiobacillus sp. CV18-2]|uniref:Sulfur reduction protein DsrE n=1 Tax=Igneacidithiobacillus copahuensis TaxID=2724909 RepID=A0AAE2YRE0_9PROT|nr:MULTISPECIES: DsrE family protein [Acidithiobacillaceae]MBU2754780.1 sulfur reduction protein DsrE [Acidithiobacillus sp. CV18-3]MBU2758386.1 sulfur reduction protein DsrE [Acidithiobacillus sp. BN09-2]MBU2776734.1 sulfur reduction protein DsrE [Acidithiobacillus sp. CV18-2]MBU2795437.1 sulfur reduction protein DsrE [Acidithiobacillus sp. VAN18-2]MBU2799027.1 sulfur reduction protein DsrE [Acidithiobacillus sp. VAN18-4]MDD3761253.1 DsrE family protein [Acidithiobacillus sp.]
MSSHYLEDDEEKTVVIVMTSGPSTAHRCATPFYLGSLLSSMDAEVKIFCTMEAVKLMEKGVAENMAAMEGGKRIIEFIRDAKNAGAELYVCRPALPGYAMEETGLIDEVDHVASAGDLADLILSVDRLLFF